MYVNIMGEISVFRPKSEKKRIIKITHNSAEVRNLRLNVCTLPFGNSTTSLTPLHGP